MCVCCAVVKHEALCALSIISPHHILWSTWGAYRYYVLRTQWCQVCTIPKSSRNGHYPVKAKKKKTPPEFWNKKFLFICGSFLGCILFHCLLSCLLYYFYSFIYIEVVHNFLKTGSQYHTERLTDSSTQQDTGWLKKEGLVQLRDMKIKTNFCLSEFGFYWS